MALTHVKAILLFAILSCCLVPSEPRILLQLWKATEPYIKIYTATVFSLVSLLGLYVVYNSRHFKVQGRGQLHEFLYPTTDLACGICNECRQVDYCCHHPLPGKYV